MSGPVIVAIDGPSGVGKTTVARRLASALGVPCLETGSLYRAMAIKVLDRGVDPDDEEAVLELAASTEIDARPEPDGTLAVLLDGERVEHRLRTPEVSELTSRIAAYPGIRSWMLELQRSTARRGGAVVEGRDIGTAVFPGTPYKFFLDAPTEVRSERRWHQLREMGNTAITLEQVRADVERRDYRDTHREVAPLVRTEGHTLIDTSRYTADEVVRLIQARLAESPE